MIAPNPSSSAAVRARRFRRFSFGVVSFIGLSVVLSVAIGALASGSVLPSTVLHALDSASAIWPYQNSWRNEFAALVAGVLAVSVITLVSWAIRTMTKLARQAFAKSADRLLLEDQRSPVLYLRSFEDEDRLSVEEEELARVLRHVGPFVAVGRPGEALPALGAARMYLTDDEWQGEVERLMHQASLVILLAGRTPGLGWELRKCRELLNPLRLVILIPSEQDYLRDFVDMLKRSANIDLGTVTAKVQRERLSHYKGRLLGAVVFDAEWQPMLRAPSLSQMAVAQSLSPGDKIAMLLRPLAPAPDPDAASGVRRLFYDHIVSVIGEVLTASGQFTPIDKKLERAFAR